MKNNYFSSISLQKNNIDNFPLEIKLMNKNIIKVKKIKFIGLNNDDIININKDIFLIKKNIKFINEAKKVRSLSIIKLVLYSNFERIFIIELDKKLIAILNQIIK